MDSLLYLRNGLRLGLISVSEFWTVCSEEVPCSSKYFLLEDNGSGDLSAGGHGGKKRNPLICRTWKLETGPLSSWPVVEFKPASSAIPA